MAMDCTGDCDVDVTFSEEAVQSVGDEACGDY